MYKDDAPRTQSVVDILRQVQEMLNECDITANQISNSIDPLPPQTAASLSMSGTQPARPSSLISELQAMRQQAANLHGILMNIQSSLGAR